VQINKRRRGGDTHTHTHTERNIETKEERGNEAIAEANRSFTPAEATEKERAEDGRGETEERKRRRGVI